MRWWRPLQMWSGVVIAVAACGSDPGPPLQPAPGLIYAFPSDGQVDVPLGARVVLTFSDPVAEGAIAPCSGTAAAPVGAVCLVGPDGPVPAVVQVIGGTAGGRIVQLSGAALAPGTTYAVYASAALAPTATNLPATGPVLHFTTRTTRLRAAAPALVAINGAAPGAPDAVHAFRPLVETSTIRLVFSQPLAPQTIALAPGALELVDALGAAVPARLAFDDIHVSIDPVNDLVAGAHYRLRVGSALTDVAGRPVAPIEVALVPQQSRAGAPVLETLRTRAAGDHGAAAGHVGERANAIEIDSPLIGKASIAMQPSAMAIELGDPTRDGPLGFTIRRGQRLAAGSLDVQLGGAVPAGLSTGAITIELVSDGGGRIYRNPHQPVSQRPDAGSPLVADLSFDLAVSAADPTGNAVLTQTVLGVQGSGVVIADDGVLDIEAMISIDLDLLGIAHAPANLVLELITDPATALAADTAPPTLLATLPGGAADPVSTDAVELVFSEPIDLDRARAGGIQLAVDGGAAVPSTIEGHGAALAIRPLAPLLPGTSYRVALADLADLAGNPPSQAIAVPPFTMPAVAATPVPVAVAAVHPGAPCALTGGGAATPGHCLTSAGPDDDYQPFTLGPDEPIDVRFTQPVAAGSVALGTACGTGSVRVEEVDAGGACARPVAGTLRLAGRALSFLPDAAWRVGGHYRLTLVSGTDATCDAGEMCGGNAVAASFSTLHRDADGLLVRSDLVIDFTGAAATEGTAAMMQAAPISDVNGSGTADAGEPASDANRVALRITGTGGIVTAASFPVPDCLPGTAEPEACMALSAAMSVEILPAAHSCPLPGGGTAASCVPVVLSPQQVVSTSLPLTATAVDGNNTIHLDTITGPLVMRLREPSGGPIQGYLIDDAGTPTLVAALELYLDAPDMRITLFEHDLHAKPLSIAVRGPLRFLPDGRIAIAAANVADVPITVNLHSGKLNGSVTMVVPAGGLALQLVSPPLRRGVR